MPYINEFSSKISHERIIKNPSIVDRLKNFKIEYEVPELNLNDIETMFKSINEISSNENNELNKINYIFTLDSSYFEIPLNNNIPSATVGIINFSVSITDLNKKSILSKNEFIDPLKFNDMFKSSLLTFVIPGQNVIINDNLSVIQSIRLSLYEFFSQAPFSKLSLLDTLAKVLYFGSKSHKVDIKCPTCKKNIDWDLENLKNNAVIKCSQCDENIFLTDWLRLHETIDEESESSSLLSRFSQVSEHLIALNFLQSIQENTIAKDVLSQIAIIIDGPLAIYGEPAKLHAYILKYLYQNKDKGFIYFGLIKNGKLKDHFVLLEKKLKEQNLNIPTNSFMLIDDEYRFKYIQKRPKYNKYFGQEVLYGQDFFFYSNKNKKYIVSLPYPVEEKSQENYPYIFDYKNYINLKTILDLLNKISIDIYEDAVLPIALAHKFASISLKPGVEILSIFLKEHIK